MEDILRQRLRQHPTPLDTDALWDKVEPRLPKKRRGILPLWVWMIAGAVLFGGLYLFLPQQPKDELRASATPPPVVADLAPPTSPPPAAAPNTTPAPVESAKPAPAPAIKRPPSAPKASVISRARPATPVVTASPVVADLLVQETALPLVRTRKTFVVPFLPLAQGYAEVVPLYERITFTLPEMVVPAIPTPEPQVAKAAINLPQPAAKVDDRKAQRLAAVKAEEQTKRERAAEKEAQRITKIEAKQAEENRINEVRLATILANEQQKKAKRDATLAEEKRRREKGEANRLAKAQEAIVNKEEREAKKERVRQDWQQAREKGKADMTAYKENARKKSERRIEAFKAEKEQDQLVREVLKRNRSKYAKADREAMKLDAGKRRLRLMKDQVLREEAHRLAKADRMAAREARRAQRALAKANKKKREKKPKNIRKKQPAYWTVEPGIALSLPSRSVSTVGDSPDGSQAEVNSQYEKGLEGITLQGLAGYHRANGLSIRTGFAFSRTNSKVESTFTTAGTEPVQAIVAIIENPDGSRNEQTGTVQVANETVTTEKYYNSVTSMDIPLLIGYRFGGTKWGLTVEAGPTFNLSSSGSAHLYDGAGNYRAVGGEHFRSKLTGQGFLANFGGAYNLSEKTMLTANLRLQGFGKGGFEDPSAGYATKYTLVGVQLGYRVRF